MSLNTLHMNRILTLFIQGLLDEKREHGGAVGLPEKKSHTHGESHGLGGSGSGSHGHDDKEKDKEDKPSLGERIKAKLHRH